MKLYTSSKNFWLIVLALTLAWCGCSWLLVDDHYADRSRELIDAQRVLTERRANETAESIRRNVHFLGGVSEMLVQLVRVNKAAAMFGPNVAPAVLEHARLQEQWTHDATLNDLSRYFAVVQQNLNVDSIFLVNAAGDSVAASSWNQAGSPIGTNYADRAWFHANQQGQRGVQYATGRTTHVAGLYFSSPVMQGGRFSGAVVTKMNMSKLDFLFDHTDAYLTDDYGVIILAHDKQLVMRTVPDAAVFAMPSAARQERYAREDFSAVAIQPWAPAYAGLYRLGEQTMPHLRISRTLPELNMTLYVEDELAQLPALQRERTLIFLLVAGVGTALILAVGAVLLYLRNTRHSKATLHAILDNATVGIWMLGLDGKIKFINETFCKAVGVTQQQFKAANHYADVLPSEITLNCMQSDQACYAQRTPHHSTEWLPFTDGKQHLLDITKVRLLDGQGKVSGLIGMASDITERKRVETLMQENEQRYRTLVEWIPQAIVVHRDGKFIYLNPVAVALFGARDAQELLGTAVLARIHPNCHQMVRDRISQNAQDGRPAPLAEEVYLRIDGSSIDVEVQGCAIDYDGAPAILAVINDIALRKQAESLEQHSLDELELLYRFSSNIGNALLLEDICEIAMDYMLNLINADRVAILLNDPARAMHFISWRGLSDTYRQQADGISPWTAQDCDPQPIYIEQVESGVQDARQRDILRQEGIQSLVCLPLLQHGQLLGKLMLCFDQPHPYTQRERHLATTISAHVAFAIDRKHAEQQFIDIFEFAPDALVITDMQASITLVNHRAELLFGYSKEELIGQPIDILIPKKEGEERRNMRQRFLNSALRPRPLGSMSRKDLRGIGKDGRIFPVEISLSPMQSQNGLVIAAAVRDVSGRQQVMDQLMSTASELEQANAQIEEERLQLASRVEERTAQLSIANRAKDSFLATMSHEIRTPLGGMLGMMELLSLTALDHDQLETLQAARNSGKGLLRIVDDILDWSKIEAGKLQLAPRPAAILPMLKGVVATYGSLASAKGIQLRYHLDDNLSPGYLFDPLRLSQILNNFTSNAIKFTASGAVEVSASLASQQEGYDEVRFCVKDSGVGLNQEQMARLFQHYEQASADTARMYGGTGLGLAICRSLAELMEGHISVESVVGQGSTFCFTARLAVANQATQRDMLLQDARGEGGTALGESAALKLYRDGVSILVVDDHPVNRMLLKQQLEQLGLHADIAAYGIVALSLWQTGHYDMVITDCHMPEMDGYELTRCIRDIEAQDQRVATPIVAWTANVMAEEEVRCKAAGMDDLLTKPTELAQLTTMLKKWLQHPEQLSVADDLSTAPDSPAAPLALETGGNVVLELAALRKIAKSPAQQVEMLQEFSLHNCNDLASLTAALQSGNPSAVAHGAHRIKGACRMVGAVQMATICAALEQAANSGDMHSARTLAQGLYEANSALEHDVARFIDAQ